MRRGATALNAAGGAGFVPSSETETVRSEGELRSELRSAKRSELGDQQQAAQMRACPATAAEKPSARAVTEDNRLGAGVRRKITDCTAVAFYD
jgi:hypothetical protein